MRPLDSSAMYENFAMEYHCIWCGGGCLWWLHAQPLHPGSRLEEAVEQLGFKRDCHQGVPLYLVR